MEENNQDLGHGLDEFMHDTELQRVMRKVPGRKLEKMLENWQHEVEAKCWTKDELDNFSVSLKMLCNMCYRVSYG
jgi:hypothetical protein